MKGTSFGGRATEVNDRTAQAVLEQRGTEVQEGLIEIIKPDPVGTVVLPRMDPASRNVDSSDGFLARGGVVFGRYSRSKALCSCGEIAELDSAVVRTKRRLGKDIECRACRNVRISRELQDLQSHFSGVVESDE